MINNKEAEYTALEQKIENMTLNLERLQSDLLLAEEKQTERLVTLRESEKVGLVPLGRALMFRQLLLQIYYF